MSCHDIWLVSAPVGHNQGLLIGVTGWIFMAAKLVLLDSTRPEDICNAIQREKVSFMPIVPSLLKRILDLERLGEYHLDLL